MGNSEVKRHAWFDDFSWDDLKAKRIVPSFKPKTDNHNFDKDYVNNPEWKDGSVVEQTAQQLERQSVQYQFRGYYYDREKTRRTTPFQSGLSSLMLETA
jgi:hypothetical protein